MIDLYGFVDVTADDWEDGVLYDHEEEAVVGCTVGSLMRGMFWLHSDEQEEFLSGRLPGKVSVWRRSAAFIFPCMTSLLTPQCLFARVCFSVRKYVLFTGGVVVDAELSSHSFALGALQFLKKFVSEESIFISNEHVYEMAKVAPLMLGSLRQEISSHMERHRTGGHRRAGLEVLFATVDQILKIIECLATLRSRKRTSDITNGMGWTKLNFPSAVARLPHRLALSMNCQRRVSQMADDANVGGDDEAHTAHAPQNPNRLHPKGAFEGAPIGVFGISTDLWDDIQEDQSSVRKKVVSFSLDSDEAVRTPAPKQPMNGAPIGVFGVSADLWDDIHSEHLYHDGMPTGSVLSSESTKELQLPRPRITLSCIYDLLDSCARSSRCDHFFLSCVDVLELARQWTLVDAAFFASIPMSSYQICELQCKNQHLQQPTSQTYATGTAAWTQPRASGGASQLRLFIDRFNAQSAWATRAVLAGETAADRAAAYERLVHLASCLQQLNNFNGCMAIVSGLLQGSVTRLSETLELTSIEVEARLESMKALMSGSKNYAYYRAEIAEVEKKTTSINKFLRHYDFQLERSSDDTVNLVPRKTLPHQSSTASEMAEVVSAVELGAVGVVPHLGPVLSELVLAQEASSVHLLDYPHLLNMDRLSVYGHTLRRIRAVADLPYWTITAVSPIMNVINISINNEVLLIAHEVADRSRNLYKLSMERENGERPVSIYISDEDNATAPCHCDVADSTSTALEAEVSPHQRPPTPSLSGAVDSPFTSDVTSPADSSAPVAEKKQKWYSPSSLFGSPFNSSEKKKKVRERSSPSLVGPTLRGSTTYYNTTEREAALARAQILNSDPAITDTTRLQTDSAYFSPNQDPFHLSAPELKSPGTPGNTHGGNRRQSSLNMYQGPESIASHSRQEDASKESPADQPPAIGSVLTPPLHSHLTSDGIDSEGKPMLQSGALGSIYDLLTPHSEIDVSTPPTYTQSRVEPFPVHHRANNDSAIDSPKFSSIHSKSYSDWLKRSGHEIGNDDSSGHTAQRHLPTAQLGHPATALKGSAPPFVFPKQSNKQNSSRLSHGNRSRLHEDYNNYRLRPPNGGIRLLPSRDVENDGPRSTQTGRNTNVVHSTRANVKGYSQRSETPPVRIDEPILRYSAQPSGRRMETVNSTSPAADLMSTVSSQFDNEVAVSSSLPIKGQRELYDVL